MSALREILIAENPTAPMRAVPSARAIAGRGLEGDRYFTGLGTFAKSPPAPDFELTLIESEVVEEFARESGLPFTTGHARRNLVTEGVRLNELVGQEFFVGAVRIRGHRLCEPCAYLAKTTFPEALRGLVHKGGLRAEILSDGAIAVGDAIRVA